MFAVKFDHKWVPFEVSGRPYSFSKRELSRLTKTTCSHWGAAIYRWEGKMLRGPFAGKLGVLIGETDDLRARINSYATGTQPSGNAYWRAQFLECCNSSLFILECTQLEFSDGLTVPLAELLRSKNGRLVMEQLLILHERCQEHTEKWIVNKWD